MTSIVKGLYTQKGTYQIMKFLIYMLSWTNILFMLYNSLWYICCKSYCLYIAETMIRYKLIYVTNNIRDRSKVDLARQNDYILNLQDNK